MLISELAKRTGLTIHTLRYYENYGLFKGTVDEAVKTNNYKQYDEKLVEKIQLIKEAKEIGFTLSEIKDLLDSWFTNQLSIERKIEVLNAKINEIDSRIRQLKFVRKFLVDGIEDVKKGDC
ncbi:MAG: MerR family transcriptional regulator [Bacteroidota bacterium]